MGSAIGWTRNRLEGASASQVGGDGLGHGEIGRLRREIAGLEAVRVAGLDQELLGALRVVGVRIDGERELHRPTELLGLVDRLAIDREARGAPHPLVVPRRLRVPLLGEVEEEDPVGPRGDELQPGVRRTSSATGPVRKYATSTSPRLSAAARVVSSGTLLKIRRLTLGTLRQ